MDDPHAPRCERCNHRMAWFHLSPERRGRPTSAPRDHVKSCCECLTPTEMAELDAARRALAVTPAELVCEGAAI